MAIPEKYSHISFVPPSGVRREAARGLAFRREHGRGGTAIGIARARDLSNGTELSPSTVRRMKAFFDRHAPDRKAGGFRAGEDGFPSNGKIADLLWGGRSGESWANKVVRQMNAADERTYSPDADTATLEEESVLQRSAVMQGVERRYFGSFEKADSNSLTVEHRADPETGKRRTYIVGYAAKFGTDSLLLGDFIERLAPSAFDIVKAGKDGSGKPLNTRCLFNHDPNHLLGRFPTTMKMTVDKIGLRYECLLPESRKDVEEMIARKDLLGSSFSFVVAEGGEKWITENGQSIRIVTKIKSLLDCSPVTYPAYDDATVEIAKRSYEVYAATTSAPKVDFDAEIRKLRKFVAERRGFCATGAGGGIDNTCGAKSGGEGDNKKLAKEALDKYEAGRKTTSGKILDSAVKGAGVGGIIGAVGGAVGVAAGAAAGAAVGAAVGAAKAVFSKGDKKLDSAMKSVGVTPQHVDAAAKSLGMKLKVEASGGDVIASGGSTSMMISKDESGVGVHFMSNGDPTESGMIDDTQGGALSKKIEDGSYTPKDGDRMLGKLADSFAKAAKAAGASHVSASLYDEESVSAFEKKGFTVVEKAKDKRSPTVVMKKMPSRRSYDDLMSFFMERRGFCATGSGGGIDNSCNGGFAGGGSKKEMPGGFAGKKTDVVSKYGSDSPSKIKPDSGKYMEWKKGDHLNKAKEKDAQDFLDNAREEQLSKGGKDEGMADEGGGVQTWSKGDHFPWTVKQVGDTDGHVQGQHPDGSKTEKYPFKGGKTSDALKKVSDEIKRRKGSRADQVISDTLKFLKERRQ
jgi:hypothetical protein